RTWERTKLASTLDHVVFAPLVPMIGYRAVLALSGYVLSNVAFVLAAVFLYRHLLFFLRSILVCLVMFLGEQVCSSSCGRFWFVWSCSWENKFKFFLVKSNVEPLLKMELNNPALLAGDWSQLCATCKVSRPIVKLQDKYMMNMYPQMKSLKILKGLPIQGQVYDEYVPTNEELEDPEVKHGQPLKTLLNCYQYLRGTGKHFIIPSDGRMGKTLNGYVIWYQEGYHNFFAEESSSSLEDSAESTQIVKRKCSFVDDPKKKQRISSDLVLKATSISQVRNKSVRANDMIVNLEGDDDHTLPVSVAPQRSPSLHKVHDKNASSAKNLDNFKDYRERASSGNSSDEDETRPKTNDNLSSHEDISKQNTSIQKDQIIVPQMNSEASGSFSSVEQVIQVFFEECKDQVLCIVSSLLKFSLSCLGFIILRVKARS
ncbi:uncharacterized protein A4U43_C05F10430, partial [Asparagus officinalis]